LNGENKQDIFEALKQNFNDIDIHKIFLLCADQIESATKTDANFFLGWLLEANRDLYRKFLDVGDFSGALAVLKEISRIVETNRLYLKKR